MGLYLVGVRVRLRLVSGIVWSDPGFPDVIAIVAVECFRKSLSKNRSKP